MAKSYPNLRAEMARHGITSKELAKALSMKPSTLSSKFAGNSRFTVAEAIVIKRFLNCDLPIEMLFEREMLFKRGL